MRMDDEQESRNVDDRRESTGKGAPMPSMQTMMILWPLIKALLRSKFGLLIIGGDSGLYDGL